MITGRTFSKSGYYDSGKVHTGERMKLNWNTSQTEYWTVLNMFGDMMQRVSGALAKVAGGEPVDANGWYDLRIGGGIREWVLWSAEDYPSYGTGKIIVTWDDFDVGNPANVALTEYSGLSFISGESSSHRKVYNIARTGSSAMRCTQTGGYAINIQVFMESDEADLLAGNLVSTQYKADLGNAPWIRWMDAMHTNNSEVVDWDEYRFNGRGNSQYLKLEHIAKISNETGIPPWLCFPTMGTDACWQSMCDELLLYLDPGMKIRAELGNEIWNYGFKNNAEFIARLDAPLIESDSFDGSTGLVTKVAHGINSGEGMNMMTFKGYWDWKYGKGADVRVMKIDDDHFKICDNNHYYTTISNITNATTAVVTEAGHPHVNDGIVHLYRFGTGMVELEDVECMVKNATVDTYELYDITGTTPINSSAYGVFTQGRCLYHLYDNTHPGYQSSRKTNSSQTVVRYKRNKDSINWNPDGYGRRSVELWAICDAKFGRDRVEAILCEQTQIDGDMRVALSRPGCRERVDYIATAPYFQLSNIDGGATPIPGDWQWADIETLTDYVINNDFPYAGVDNRLDGISRMINDAHKCYRFITYEGGDHTTTGSNTQQSVKHWEWTTSKVNGPSGIPAMQRCYEAYYKRLSELGVKEHSIYTMAHRSQQPEDSVPWGTMNVTGDQTTPKYQAFKTFDDIGGVP